MYVYTYIYIYVYLYLSLSLYIYIEISTSGATQGATYFFASILDWIDASSRGQDSSRAMPAKK